MKKQMHRALALKVVFVIIALLFTETSYAASGDASTGHFSQQQIVNIVKTVTTELELSKNWKSSFANTVGSKLYCNSVVLGEGVRAGNHGLYTWFTCSAMHKLEITKSTSAPIVCTGFSSPVWIQPSADSINFQTFSYRSEYLAFKTSAPVRVQTLMDSTFNQLNSRQPRVVIARATQGASTATSSHQTAICQ